MTFVVAFKLMVKERGSVRTLPITFGEDSVLYRVSIMRTPNKKRWVGSTHPTSIKDVSRESHIQPLGFCYAMKNTTKFSFRSLK